MSATDFAIEAIRKAAAEKIIAALIETGPGGVMRTRHKFDEPDLRATIYEALNLETD